MRSKTFCESIIWRDIFCHLWFFSWSDFAPVFNKLAVKVLEELPAIQQPFLQLCENYFQVKRPFLQIAGADTFLAVIDPLINSLGLNAIQFLSLAGASPSGPYPELQARFEAIPLAILTFLRRSNVKSKNGVFPVDEAGDLPLVYDDPAFSPPALSCERRWLSRKRSTPRSLL
jgi:hypothetical protein